MANVKNEKATVETAFGQKLDSPIEFDYTWNELQEGEEVPGDEIPKGDEIRKYANQNRKSKARSAAQAKAFSAAGIKKPDYNNDNFALNEAIKMLQTRDASLTREVAEQRARVLLGM